MIAAAALLGTTAAAGVSLVAAPLAAAAPGQPGVPGTPVILFEEDFSNGMDADPILLTDYVGLDDVTYTADQPWLQNCNGAILSFNSPDSALTEPALNECQPWVEGTGVGPAYNQLRRLAYALGALNGSADPDSNHVVAAYTHRAHPGADLVQFRTVDPIALPSAAGRFVTFSVDTAALNCGVSGPRYNFALIEAAGDESPVGDTINACEGGQSVEVPGVGSIAAAPVFVNNSTSAGSVLVSGSSVGVVMRNANGSGTGNDAAFDNIRLLDVTPQLDKAFSPTTVPAGGVSTLTLTVTNTEEMASKEGWSFTDTLPTGLVLASPTGLTTTCDADIAVTAGGSSVALTNGSLATEEASCAVTVQVTSELPPSSELSTSFINGPANFTSLVGLNPPAPATVTFTRTPGIAVVKSASPTTVTAAGQSVTYSFLVTNTGTTDLADVTVAETAFSGSNESPTITCPPAAALLTSGSDIICTATYVASQEDADAGRIDNTAIATGTPPGGAPISSLPSSAQVTIPANPALTLLKSAEPSVAAPTVVGQEIAYSFLVTNTGNVTLTDIVVNEGSFTGSGDLSEITCPAGSASLAPAAHVTCTATYTLTQADLDAGLVVNDATATGTPPTGPPVISPPSEVTIPLALDPSLTIAKTSDPSSFSAAGQAVTYSFLVTNSGGVTLTDVTVDEGDFTGTGELSAVTCPATASSMAPAAVVTCTATYVTTQEDVDAGGVTNSATATGSTPAGTAVTSPPSQITIPAPQDPSIALVKTADITTVTYAGQSITYSFLATNTGNVTLTGVTVQEGDFTGTGPLSAIECPATALAPGAALHCTATYRATAADLTRASLSNTATTTGSTPDGAVVGSSPSTAVVHVAVVAHPPLANTGATLLPQAFSLGAALLLAGALLTTGTNRGRRRVS